MSETPTAKLFDLEPNDEDAAFEVAQAFKRRGELTGEIVKILLKMQTDHKPLLKRIADLGVDKGQHRS